MDIVKRYFEQPDDQIKFNTLPLRRVDIHNQQEESKDAMVDLPRNVCFRLSDGDRSIRTEVSENFM